MKKLFVLAAGLLLFAIPGFSQAAKAKNSDAEQQVVNAEKQLWEGWKNKDFDPFKQNLSADAVMIDMGGIIYGKDKAVDMLSKTPCEVRSYALSDTKVDWIDRNTALLTYKADSDATCGGQKSPPSVYASSIWVDKNGKWQGVFHQETPIGQGSNP